MTDTSTSRASTVRSGTVVGASRCTAPLGRIPAAPCRSITRHCAAASAEGIVRPDDGRAQPRVSSTRVGATGV